MNFLSTFGPRVKKFALYPMELDSPINILEGSVRSSKTWALHAKILQGCRYPVAGWRFITGQSKDTIFTNVLNDLFAIVGSKYYSYNHQTGILRMLNSTWKVMGAKDEGSEKFLRGSTIGLAICDEVVLMPKGFFQMLLTRMSPKGARLYGSTNPDSPMHWLKTDYLDDPVLRAKKLLYSLHVTMDDNPNLEPEFVAAQKAFYKGLFYQRFILGQWVMAEGTIWGDCWDDSLIYDELPDSVKSGIKLVDRWIAQDYGTNHPNVFGEFLDDGDSIWLDRELVWDSNKEMRQKTDEQYADDLVEFMGANNGCQVIVPPEALSMRTSLVNRGVWVTEANNEIKEGLETVAAMMSVRKFRINRRCVRCLRGIHTHVWDPNKAKRGIEEPLKQDDDECLAPGIQILLKRGLVEIENVCVGDEALTRFGWKKVIASRLTDANAKRKRLLLSDGRQIIGTANHPVFIDGHFRAMDTLRYGDIIPTWQPIPLFSTESHSDDIRTPRIQRIAGITWLLEMLKASGFSIGEFGQRLLAQFRELIQFTTKTGIPSTILSGTWSACLNQNIPVCTAADANLILNCSPELGRLLQSGINQKKAGCGTGTPAGNLGERDKKFQRSALNAERNSQFGCVRSIISALTPASLSIEDNLDSTIFKRNVHGADVYLSLIATTKSHSAPAHVLQVTSTENGPVYNLEIEGGHEYLANGILVHNCDMIRYGLHSKIPKYRYST